MTLSPKLVALGMCAPLPFYYHNLLEWFDLAPLQLSPNSYKLTAALYILYHDLGFDPPPPMPELSYFFSLRASDIGYYYLVIWKLHFGKGFSEGHVSNAKGRKDPYFYVYDVSRVRAWFNTVSSK